MMKKVKKDWSQDVYLSEVKDDSFIHFTTPERANQIIDSGKLLMNPPYKKFGTDAVNAISTTYGSYSPKTQVNHQKADDIVAIYFKTDTVPNIGFPEEVVWKNDVNLINPKIISKDNAISMLDKFDSGKDEDGDDIDFYVLYDEKDIMVESMNMYDEKGLIEYLAANNSKEKFIEFMQILRTDKNSDIIDAVSKGYHMIYESVNYPSGFDINEFASIKSFAGRKRYAAERLPKVGEGSSRIVYKIDDETVLKIAKNKKGLAQNQVETDWGMHQMYSDLLPDLIEADDDDYLWLVKQRANRIKKSDFERMTGHKFEDFGTALRLRADEIMGRLRGSIPDEYEDILDDEFVNDVISLIIDFDLEPGDMAQIGNWGKLSDEQDPVLTDVGLTRSVWKEHYQR